MDTASIGEVPFRDIVGHDAQPRGGTDAPIHDFYLASFLPARRSPYLLSAREPPPGYNDER